MNGQSMPAAEVDITAELVRALLAEQLPEFTGLRLRLLANGWDNIMFRLGEELVVRLPRRAAAAQLVLHESRWLPELASRLPLPVPAPVSIGQPTDYYPWQWTVVPWIEGEPVGSVALTDSSLSARRLGGFLAALHTPAPVDAPLNPYRGGPLAGRAEAVVDRIAKLAGEIDVDMVQSNWDSALAQPAWTGPPMWLHGDLHPHNLIKRDGAVVAVVDFGDITSGDPATDFLVAWALFDEDDRATFREAAETPQRPIDDSMWERGRGWAIVHGLAVVANSADAPAMMKMGRRELAAATA